MAEQLKELVTFPEDLSSVSTTQLYVHSLLPSVTPAPADPVTSSGLCTHLHTCTQKFKYKLIHRLFIIYSYFSEFSRIPEHF